MSDNFTIAWAICSTNSGLGTPRPLPNKVFTSETDAEFARRKAGLSAGFYPIRQVRISVEGTESECTSGLKTE